MLMGRSAMWVSSLAFVFAMVLMPTWSAFADGLLQEIKQRGALQLCIADSPDAIKDLKTGDWVGIDPDLAQMYATRLGVKVVWVESSWGNIVPSVLAKKCDVAWGPFTMNPERGKTVNYTAPVHNTGLLVVVRKGDTRFPSYDDLDKPSVTFAQLPEPVLIQALHEFFPKAEVKVVQSKNVTGAALEVAAGRAEANLTDALVVYDMVNKNAGVEIVPGPILRKHDYAFIIRKEDNDLLASVNAFIEEMEGNGTLAKLRDKWGIPKGFR